MAGTNVVIQSHVLRAEIAPLGAELVRLTHRDHGELMWARDPAVWDAVSPILFPVVGKVRDDAITVNGRRYPMQLHGFASTTVHELVEQDAGRCRFRLAASEATRRAYPFDFELGLEFTVEGPELSIAAEVKNRGTGLLSAAFGHHPGFRWPLPGAASKAGHALEFPADTSLRIRRLADGLVVDGETELPLDDHRLVLDESLFAGGSIMAMDVASPAVTFRAADAACAIEVRSTGMPHVALWMKPGHDYLCIEPRHGYADPAGFAGEFATKPGLFHLPPGGARGMVMTVAVRD